MAMRKLFKRGLLLAVAAVLAGMVAGWDQTNLATAYTYFVPDGTAGSTLNMSAPVSC